MTYDQTKRKTGGMMHSDLVETTPVGEVVAGTGSTYPDLCSPGADIPTAKIRLATAINSNVAGRKLTQKGASAVLDIAERKVSALQNYKLDGFSMFHLMHFATALNFDVVVQLRPKAGAQAGGRVAVVAAA